MGDVANTALNVMPGTGDAVAVQDAIRYGQEGRPGMAAFSAATALPGIGDVAAMLKGGGLLPCLSLSG